MDSDFDFSKVSFIVDADGNRQAALLPIELYQQLLALKSLVIGDITTTPKSVIKPESTTEIATHEEFQFLVKHARARGYPVDEQSKPKFMVMKGSTANGGRAKSLRPSVEQQRDRMIADGVLSYQNGTYLFLSDYCFNSPSAAACLIAGNARSGLDAWVDSEGQSLKQRGYGRVS